MAQFGDSDDGHFESSPSSSTALTCFWVALQRIIHCLPVVAQWVRTTLETQWVKERLKKSGENGNRNSPPLVLSSTSSWPPSSRPPRTNVSSYLKTIPPRATQVCQPERASFSLWTPLQPASLLRPALVSTWDEAMRQTKERIGHLRRFTFFSVSWISWDRPCWTTTKPVSFEMARVRGIGTAAHHPPTAVTWLTSRYRGVHSTGTMVASAISAKSPCVLLLCAVRTGTSKKWT